MAGPLGTAGGIVGKWFGNAISEATAFAAGIAIGPVLGPPVQALKNETWKAYPNVPPDAGTMAAGVAQGQVDPVQAAEWAKEHGFSQTAFDALVDVANTGPPLGLAYDAWRRGELDPDEFTAALKRTGLEDEWNTAMKALKLHLLSPADIANAVQQGHVPDDGILPPPVGGGMPFSIPLTQIPIDPLTEALKQGWDENHLKVMTNLAGLPPGDHELLDMWNRGIIDEASVDAGIREGHRKTKWIPAVKELRHPPLSHIQYVDARVRGYIDNAAMYAGGALTGHTPEQMDLLHKTHGRPPSWHQIWIGLQRGGKMLSPTADLTAAGTGIDPVFWSGLQQSSIQQQWYEIIWVQRYNYPPPFVLRLLTTTKVLTAAETEDVLKWEGYEPTFAAKIATAWSGATTTTAAQKKQTLAHLTDEYLSGALTRAALTTALTALGYTAQQANDEITLAEFNAAKAERTRAARALEKRFVGATLSPADATTALAAMGLPPAAIAQKLTAWTEERNAGLTTLTVGQIEKALKAGALTQAQAIPLLQDLGEDAAAIQTILATNGPKLSIAQIEGELSAGTLAPADATLLLQSLGLNAAAIAAVLAAHPPPA